MAKNQKYKERRVNTLPTSGLFPGDRYYLNVGNNKYQTWIVSDLLQLTKDAGAEFIECDTMAQMRALSSREIWALENGYYKGVKLNGYYSKNDTPAPIDYYLSNTTDLDDGSSVIVVGGVKLETQLGASIDVSYFGISHLNTNNTLQLSNLYKYINKTVSDLFSLRYYANKSIKLQGSSVFETDKNIEFGEIVFDIKTDIYFKSTESSIRNIKFLTGGVNTKLLELENCVLVDNIYINYDEPTTLTSAYINPINIADSSNKTRISNISIENYVNTTGACNFMGIRVGSSSYNIDISKIVVKDITQLGNGTIGDAFGAVRGIYWHNITQDVDNLLLCSGKIHEVEMSNFKNINSSGVEITEDCDGIHVYGYGTDLIPHGYCDVAVFNCDIKNTGKRNVKFQATGCRLGNSKLRLDNGGENLFIFSRKTFIDFNQFYNNGGIHINGAINNSKIDNNYFEGNGLNEYVFQMQSFANNTINNSTVKGCKTHFRYLTSSEDYVKHGGFKNSFVNGGVFYLSSSVDLKAGSNSAEFNPIEYRDATFILNMNESLSTKILASSRHIRSKFILESISATNHIFNVNFTNKYLFKDCSLEIKPSVVASNHRIFQAQTYATDLTVENLEIIGNSKSFYFGYINCGKLSIKSVDMSTLGSTYALFVKNNEASITTNILDLKLENINLNTTQLLRIGEVSGVSVDLKNITINNDKQLVSVLNNIQAVGILDSIVAERLYVGISNLNLVTSVKTTLDSGLYYKPDKSRFKIVPDSTNKIELVAV